MKTENDHYSSILWGLSAIRAIACMLEQYADETAHIEAFLEWLEINEVLCQPGGVKPTVPFTQEQMEEAVRLKPMAKRILSIFKELPECIG